MKSLTFRIGAMVEPSQLAYAVARGELVQEAREVVDVEDGAAVEPSQLA